MPICALIFLLMASTFATAAPTRVVPSFEVHAKVDKKNALLNFDKGAAAAMITKESLDGIVGETGDFPVGTVKSFIIFNESVPEQKLMELANFQGRLKGTVLCERVRLGSSPLHPELKMAVLAEGCTIKSLNH